MKKLQCLPQEILKLIACVTMLIDHMGAALFPQLRFLRIIGRIAFPIYCFLLAEGMRRTRDPHKYLLRLFLGIFLAELPFDYLFFGGFTWQHQSVMVTLFLGGTMLLCLAKTKKPIFQFLIILPFAALADACMCDYGAMGIVMIAIFAIAPTLPVQLICVFLLCLADGASYISASLKYFPGWPVEAAVRYILRNSPPIEIFAIFAMAPIGLYSSKKLTHSRAVQWSFYLFYPVHLTLLWVISNFLL